MHFLQILIPFFIAGLGTCIAGVLLDYVQNWEVFVEVDELFLLLPALLGLKGNLQMTLASRLSTHSHLGHLQTREDLLNLTCANLSLNQFLSIVIGSLASCLVVVMHYFTSAEEFDARHPLLLASIACLTSSVTSFLLDIVMVIVVQVSAYTGLNPDNVATPIAASLGDVTALGLSSITASVLFEIIDTQAFNWITMSVILIYILLLPIWINIIQGNVHTCDILKKASHWYPLLTAMIISSISGIILKGSVPRFKEIALFQPVICGVGGNLVAVHASRLATLLHRTVEPTQLPDGDSVCMNPLKMFYSTSPGFDITRLLMIIVVPGQLVFYFLCVYVNTKNYSPPLGFLGLYLLGSEIQVIILLYAAYVLTYLLWTYGVDPDNSTIPYLTSMSDVLGAQIITIICTIVNPNSKAEEKQPVKTR